MGTNDKNYEELVKWKRGGGVRLEVFVSDGVWLGGAEGARGHEPFVAIAPADWDGEEDVTFFKDPGAVEAFVAEIREAGRKAFGE